LTGGRRSNGEGEAHVEDKGDRAEAIEKLNQMIKSVRIAMLTTVEPDGSLRSRPMAAQEMEPDDADLWFFTQQDAPKVGEVEHDRHVNVTFSDHDEQKWISLTGKVQIVRDRAKVEELWKPFLKTWFPRGKEDPALTLLKVKVDKVEYWDEKSSPIAVAFGFGKALVTGERSQAGVGKKVEM
jgi:general stress protein 26